MVSISKALNCYWLFSDSTVGISAEEGVSSTSWHVFDKMLQRIISHQVAGETFSHPCFKFTDKVYDRGKVVQLIEGYFYSVGAYEGSFHFSTSCMIILLGSILTAAYNDDFVSKLILEPFGKLPDHGISSLSSGVCSYKYFVYTCSLFDCGKKLTAINWFSYIAGVYEVNVVITATGLLVFTICSILLAEYNDNSACALVLHHGSGLNLLLMHSIALVVVTDSAIGVAHMLIIELSDLSIWDLHSCEKGILLQLKCHLPVGIEVNCIETFTVMFDGHKCELLQILSRGFKFLMVLNSSVTIVATTYFYLLRIGSFQHSPLLISDIYGNSMVQEGVLMTVRHFSWSCLRTSYCAWYFPSCVSQVKALMSLVGTHLMLTVILISKRWILVVTLKLAVTSNFDSHGAQLGFVLGGILGQDGILNQFTSSSIVTAVPVFTLLKVWSYVMLICSELCEQLEAHLWATATCTEISGSLVNFKGGTTTMYEHNTVQEIDQLTSGLRVDVPKDFRWKIFLFGTHYFFMVTQILQVLAWVDFLKWKFRLFSTKLYSVINVSIDNIIISVECLDINRTHTRNWFCEGTVHNKIAQTLQRSNMFLSSTIWPLSALPKTLVWMGYGRLLFDRVIRREASWHVGSVIRDFSTMSHSGTKILLRRGDNHLKTVDSNFPVVFLLVVSLEWKGTINGDAPLKGVLMCNSGQLETFDGATTRSIFPEFSAFTLLIEPTGEVKIGFEVCTGTFNNLATFLEFSSSVVFDRGRSFSSHVWSLGYQSGGWTAIVVRKGVNQDILVKIHRQFELEVQGQELMAFKRKHSTKRNDLCVPFFHCNTARDKVHDCLGKTVDFTQLTIACAGRAT